METIKCKSLADLASLILKNSSDDTYINLRPSDIGIDSPDKLFFFLVGILNECLTILCDTNEILLEHLYTFQKKIEPVGFKMKIHIEPNDNIQKNRILMGHMRENDGANLQDYKIVSIFPGTTYVLSFDYVARWKDTATCKKPHLK